MSEDKKLEKQELADDKLEEVVGGYDGFKVVTCPHCGFENRIIAIYSMVTCNGCNKYFSV